MKVIDLAFKDLLQIVRDWRAAVFLVVMPVVFTLMFGFAFGGFGGDELADPRLPIGSLDEDKSVLSGHFFSLLGNSEVVRVTESGEDLAGLEQGIEDGDLAAAVVVPAGYEASLQSGEVQPIRLLTGSAGTANMAIEGEIQAASQRLASAVLSAQFAAETYEAQASGAGESERQAVFEAALSRAVAAWAEPPVGVLASQQGQPETEEEENAFSQSSPGMMAQFSIAGLMGAASILVLERKSRALRRLLTTAISRPAILLGHYLAMFVMIFGQLAILIVFGQLLLRLDYLGQPLATLLMAVTAALFAASLGLFVGAVAKSEEQVLLIALILMFVLSGLGGAWVPLEITPEGFQAIARFTPLAWVMGGFQDIIIRGLGVEAILTQAALLAATALMIFVLAVWRFRFE